MTDKVAENIEIKIGDEIRRYLGSRLEFAYLLGSAGTERFNAESDIDLAVFWKVEPEFAEMLKIRSHLSQFFNREVDLVALNTTDLIFARQVLETGRLLLCNEPGIHLRWKADQMSRYPDFKFTRAVIEKNILTRKKYV